MSSKRKEMLGIVVVAILFAGAYFGLRQRPKPEPGPGRTVEMPQAPEPVPNLPATPAIERLRQTVASATAGGITQEEAVEIARRFCDAVGWKAEGDIKIESRHYVGTPGASWDVSWFRAPGHDHEWAIGVHGGTGQILRASHMFVGDSDRVPGTPTISNQQAVEVATRFAHAAGFGQDARLVGVEYQVVGADTARGVEAGTTLVEFGRYLGQARYVDDAVSIRVNADSGEVMGMGRRWGTPPPPDVPINITQKEAIELGKKYLTDRAIMGGSGIGVTGVNKVQLSVVGPTSPKTMLRGQAHQDEPSRIAWVVEYNRYGGPYGHVAEAWIDVEDGSFLGGNFCG